MKFRTKAVEIDAMLYTGKNESEIFDWVDTATSDPPCMSANDKGITIETLEGDHLASPGDWVIRGLLGEYYPCKPKAFEAKYERVE